MTMQPKTFLTAVLFWTAFNAPFAANSTPFPAAVSCNLPAPASLSVSSVGASWVSLSWAAVSEASSYRVQVFALPGGELAAEVQTSAALGTITGLSAGGSYRCAVTSQCANESSLSSHDNTIVIDIVLNNNSPADEAPATATAVTSPAAPSALLAQNPFSTVLTILLPTPGNTPVHVQVFNLHGRLMLEKRENATERLEVPTETWAAGSYVVVVKTPAGTRILRAVKG